MLPSKQTITRPANTTAYTAGDVIGIDNGAGAAGSAILTFPNVCGPGGLFYLTDLSLTILLSAIPSGMTTFRLHLYDDVPDAIVDNAAWVLTSAGDKGKYLGFVDFGAPAVVGGLLHVRVSGLSEGLIPAVTTKNISGQLVTTAGYTPTSGEQYIVRFGGVGVS